MSDPNQGDRGVETVRELYDAFAAGDLERARACVDEGFVWHEPPGHPWSGDHHGLDGLLSINGTAAEAARGVLTVDVHDMLASDDHVVLQDVTATVDGETVRLRETLVAHLRDGAWLRCGCPTSTLPRRSASSPRASPLRRGPVADIIQVQEQGREVGFSRRDAALQGPGSRGCADLGFQGDGAGSGWRAPAWPRVEIRLATATSRTGAFDAISRMGMFEHVGVDRLEEYPGVLLTRLRPGGRLLNHGIARPEPRGQDVTVLDGVASRGGQDPVRPRHAGQGPPVRSCRTRCS